MAEKSFMAALTKRPMETVNIEGVEIEVRGLSLGEARAIEKLYPDNSRRGLAVIVASCFVDGERAFTIEALNDVVPGVIYQLDEVVGRVNGAPKGNSKATELGDSSLG